MIMFFLKEKETGVRNYNLRFQESVHVDADIFSGNFLTLSLQNVGQTFPTKHRK